MDNLREQAKGAAMIFLKNYDKNDYDELLEAVGKFQFRFRC